MYNQKVARISPIHLAGIGMALQRAVDLLPILSKNYSIYGVNNSDISEFVKNRFLNNTLTGVSMDRRLEQFNRESVRMTVLKHEEIFKEQVRELHRLYKVQKMLMAELRNDGPNPSLRTTRSGGKCIETDNRSGFWRAANMSDTNQTPFSGWNQSSSNQPSSGYNLHPLFSTRADSCVQEQTSSCSRDTCRIPKGFDLEQPAEEISTDVSANISSNSCDPYFRNDGEGEVELTLSIGFETSKKKTRNRKTDMSRELGRTSSSNYERRQSDRGEETSDRESLQQPPWLLQGLSLNRT